MLKFSLSVYVCSLPFVKEVLPTVIVVAFTLPVTLPTSGPVSSSAITELAVMVLTPPTGVFTLPVRIPVTLPVTSPVRLPVTVSVPAVAEIEFSSIFTAPVSGPT